MQGEKSNQLVELLWGSQERSSRGPKPDLSLARIARAALAIADAEGLAAVSMRRVAEQLGFTTMALYRYVPGKTELLAVMLDTAIGDPPGLDDVAGGWRAKLALWARANWELFHRHPWTLQLVARHRPMGPHEVAWFEAALGAISGIGLTEGELVEVVGLVNGYVRGTAQLSLHWGPAELQSGANALWWAASSPLRKQLAATDRYPTLQAVAAAGIFDQMPADESAAGLEFGLQRVLDGIEAFVQTRQSGQP